MKTNNSISHFTTIIFIMLLGFCIGITINIYTNYGNLADTDYALAAIVVFAVLIASVKEREICKNHLVINDDKSFFFISDRFSHQNIVSIKLRKSFINSNNYIFILKMKDGNVINQTCSRESAGRFNNIGSYYKIESNNKSFIFQYIVALLLSFFLGLYWGAKW